MSGHMTCFRKSDNGFQTTINQRGKVEIFESLKLISIIIEVKPPVLKIAYESAVSS